MKKDGNTHKEVHKIWTTISQMLWTVLYTYFTSNLQSTIHEIERNEIMIVIYAHTYISLMYNCIHVSVNS